MPDILGLMVGRLKWLAAVQHFMFMWDSQYSDCYVAPMIASICLTLCFRSFKGNVSGDRQRGLKVC